MKRKTEAPSADPLAILTPQERSELRVFMQKGSYQKLLSISENFRPSSNCPKAGSNERDAFSGERASARLAEMRGWDLHVTALFAALNPPEQIRKQLEETFPDEGRMDFTPEETKPPTAK